MEDLEKDVRGLGDGLLHPRDKIASHGFYKFLHNTKMIKELSGEMAYCNDQIERLLVEEGKHLGVETIGSMFVFSFCDVVRVVLLCPGCRPIKISWF